MEKREEIAKINKELKIIINEASFISMKCRNRLLRIFEEEFSVKLDISNYQNVDLKIKEDYSIVYRDDEYVSEEKIQSISDLMDRYHRFQERANQLIKKKDIDFQNKSNWNNISNLIMIICLILILICLIVLVVYSFLTGDLYNCLWLLVFVVPLVVPKVKESLTGRFIQAKNYLKSIMKKGK